MPNRLHQLLDLAQAYRGWSRAELARALHRDPSRLYGESENPKLDFVATLADVLEWPIDAVIEFIYTGLPKQDGKDGDGAVDIEKLREEIRGAVRAGEYRETIELARKMFRVASTPDDRAWACSLESSGWDGLGRFQRAQQAIHRGLLQSPRDFELIQVLQSNLANVHFTLWELESAIGVAGSLIEWYDEKPPHDLRTRVTQAFAHYVRGTSFRRKLSLNDPDMQRCARRAREDLAFASERYKQLAADYDRPDLDAIAHSCDGGLIEARVEIGELEPDEAISQVLKALEPATNVDDVPPGNWLESYGWWCVFGAKIALRHLEGDKLQHYLAIFTNKALEIARRAQHAGFASTVFLLEYKHQRERARRSGEPLLFILDDEDIELVLQAMAGVPYFRPIGWDILRHSADSVAALKRAGQFAREDDAGFDPPAPLL